MNAFRELHFQSATDSGELYARLYRPTCKSPAPRLIQIVHGMAEHIGRYDAFCCFLAEHGWHVCLHDLPGHGRSAPQDSQTGYFGEREDSAERVLDDLDTLYGLVCAELNLPTDPIKRVLFGHSMGSLIARAFVIRPAERLSGAVFCGTTGNNTGAGFGLMLARRAVRKRGPSGSDQRLERLLAAGRNRHIRPLRSAFDWLSSDPAQVDAYLRDPRCGFAFKAAGFRDLLLWQRGVSSRKWADQVPKTLPILIISGDRDPVGAFGHGPRQVARRLRRTGCAVTLKLYPSARHEILNERNRQEVFADVAAWLDRL